MSETMPDLSMVEMVAEALYLANRSTQVQNGFAALHDFEKATFRHEARAAIAAMMEPTAAMEAAFINATINRWATPDGLRDGYRAMIQAALSEAPADA